MNINAFVVELIETYRDHHCGDIDGATVQDLLLKHGLCVERPITKEEAEEEWAEAFDIEEGDTAVVDSEEFAALKRRWAA